MMQNEEEDEKGLLRAQLRVLWLTCNTVLTIFCVITAFCGKVKKPGYNEFFFLILASVTEESERK